ncbi:MAG: hypothetical protein ABIR37_02470 [Candidatus Saccharimonadales bacterium]
MRHFIKKCKHLVASLMTVGLVLVLTSGSALAARCGDNGDVKVHASTTAQTDQRDEPKVCEFYLDAFNFDGLQSVNWHIVKDTHGATALSGDITLDQNGHGVTSNYTLTNGMYKLYWNFDGQNGSAKHKVFKVECAPTETAPCPPPAPKPTPCPKPVPVPCPKPTPTPTTPTPPVVGRGGGEVLAAATTTTPVATLPNTGVSTLTTSLLSLMLLAATAAVVAIRPRKQEN